jgi:pilus assembly protein Flp/PilA
MNNLLRHFIADESAANAIEYGLIATLIALALIPVVQGLGSRLGIVFTAIRNALG